MATSLSAQLQKLATPQTQILDDKRKRSSLLFDASHAANYGKDVYYDIGRTGFEELLTIDKAFSQFNKTLFGDMSKDYQRAVADKEKNKKTDEEIEKFLLLVSPYLEKQAAIKALEWLVYRYMVNLMNKRALLMCFFPYYESPLFIRILQIIELKGETDEWYWLASTRKSGQAMGKKTIFTRWTVSKDFRAFLTEYMKKMLKVHEKQSNLKIAFAFYISTIIGGLTLLHNVKEEHLLHIVKMLPSCLLSSHQELVAGMYLIISHLSVKTRFSNSLLQNVLRLMSESDPPEALTSQFTLCLMTLCHHQKILVLNPDDVEHLQSKKFVFTCVEDLAKTKSVAPYLSAYMAGFFRWILNNCKEPLEMKADKVKTCMRSIQSLSLSVSDSSRIIRRFLEIWQENFKALEDVKDNINMADLVNEFELNHPDGYSQAIVKFTSTTNDSSSKAVGFSEILEEILTSGSSVKGSSVKFIHIVHPEDSVRLAAAESFTRRVNKGLESDEKMVQMYLQYMLADDNPEIVIKGLSIRESTSVLPARYLLEECQKLMKKSEERGRAWNTVKKKTAEFVSENLSICCGEDDLKDILYMFLPFILCPKNKMDFKVAKLVLNSQLAAKIPIVKAIGLEMSVLLTDEEVDKNKYSTVLWSKLPEILRKYCTSDRSFWKIVRNRLSQEETPIHQFISLVLLYFGISDEKLDKSLSLELAHLVLDYSLLTVSYKKRATISDLPMVEEITHVEFKKYCDEVSEGKIVIQFVAVCLLQALKAFEIPELCKTNTFWMPEMENVGEGNLMLLLKGMKVAFDIEQYGDHGKEIRNKILASILKDCLKTVQHQYRFLAIVWGWHPSLSLSNIVDRPLMVWSLNLGTALFDIYSGNLAWMLSSKEPFIPALISATSSSTMPIRKSALSCMKKLVSIEGGRLVENNLGILLEKILEHSEEILADDRQLLMCMCQFSESQPTQCLQVLKLLVEVITSKIPPHVKMALMYSLSCMENVNVLRNLLPLAEELLLQVNNCKQDQIDVATSYTLYYILLLFSPSTSAILEEGKGWDTFVKAVTCSNAIMKIKEELVSPQNILLEQVMTQKFFASMKKEELQAKLWSHLITCVVESEDPQVASRLRSGLRKTRLDARFIVNEISALNITVKVSSVREAQAKRIKQKKEANQLADEKNWKRLGLMLETIGVMASLERPWMLTNILCECLQQTVNKVSLRTDLIQQQILSALLHLLQKSKEELGKEASKSIKLNIELIVQCIRSSVSPDTHRRALLILALAADLFPDLVLHNMMSIFTFMGTSLLRRDDSYSFQVIHQTIKSIVPVLIKTERGQHELKVKLARVCQVFVDALHDLPEHRRLPLFKQLANTIDVERHLWILLALMAEYHVMKGSTIELSTKKEDDHRTLPRTIEFSLTLCSNFDVLHQVNACCSLIEYINKLPEEVETLYKNKMAKTAPKKDDIIHWERQSSKHFINFKYTSAGLLAHLLSSEKFVAEIAKGEDDMEEELQDSFKLLLENTMSYLQSVTQSCEKSKEKPSGKLWLALQRKIVDVLEGIISVLPPTMLLKVVDGLLTSPIPLVRCRATELLCSKLQPSSTFFSKEDLLDLLPFVDILRKVGMNSQEPIENRQVGMYALQLLTKHLAPHVKTGAIEPVMSTAVELVCNKDTSVKVVTQALLVIAEAVGSLKGHAVNHLSRLMPVITRLLVKSDSESDHLALAAATATHRIVENMAEFLSPHLGDLTCAVCRLCAMKEEAFIQESRLGIRLAAMRDSLPQRVEARLMIPKLSEAYVILSEREELAALQPLMMMVETLITKNENKVVIAQKPAFIDMFTQALDLRSIKGDNQNINAVESIVCSALGKLLLRLNEHDNIAIFVKLQFWAVDTMDSKPSRLITFYRFADHLAETLKVLFIQAKLADNLYSQTASVLERNNSLNNQDTIFGTNEEAHKKTTVLMKYVIDTLTKIFRYDAVSFTNQERFQLMVQPLVNQLENTQIGKESYKDLIANNFIPCVVAFTNAVGDDSLWKDLNHAILSRLRNDDEPHVVLAALQTFDALIEAYGEDYLQPLVADIMPYITEVFEMVDPEVEAATKDIYQKMESILGDSFRTYLDR